MHLLHIDTSNYGDYSIHFEVCPPDFEKWRVTVTHRDNFVLIIIRHATQGIDVKSQQPISTSNNPKKENRKRENALILLYGQVKDTITILFWYGEIFII